MFDSADEYDDMDIDDLKAELCMLQSKNRGKYTILTEMKACLKIVSFNVLE